MLIAGIAIVVWSVTTLIGGSGFDAREAVGAPDGPVPDYRVVSQDGDQQQIRAELELPQPAVSAARAAIADYITAHDDRDYIGVTVPVSEGGGCHARYVANEQIATAMTDIRSQTYPAVEVNCP